MPKTMKMVIRIGFVAAQADNRISQPSRARGGTRAGQANHQ